MVPAEAASGGVSALAGAALAATAAGVGAAVNYWAAMEDETAGDIKVLSKGKGIMRLMSTNLRRVKREQGDGDEMAERVWIDTLQAVEDAGVDVWAAQDTGVEDGGSPGQAALWSAGKLQQKVGSGWGGEDGLDTPARAQGGQRTEKRRYILGSEGRLEGRDAQGED